MRHFKSTKAIEYSPCEFWNKCINKFNGNRRI